MSSDSDFNSGGSVDCEGEVGEGEGGEKQVHLVKMVRMMMRRMVTMLRRMMRRMVKMMRRMLEMMMRMLKMMRRMAKMVRRMKTRVVCRRI